MTNETIKQEYQLPPVLPNGWRTAVAKALGVHRNTIYNALQEGESHPLYKKIMHTLKIKYGKPIKKEESCTLSQKS